MHRGTVSVRALVPARRGGGLFRCAAAATRSAVLASLTRVAQKGDKDVLKALADQIELEATKTGLRDLVETMRITALVIGRRG